MSFGSLLLILGVFLLLMRLCACYLCLHTIIVEAFEASILLSLYFLHSLVPVIMDGLGQFKGERTMVPITVFLSTCIHCPQ